MTALEQGMGGVALILGFALLCSRRVNLSLLWTGAQAAAVSLAGLGLVLTAVSRGRQGAAPASAPGA